MPNKKCPTCNKIMQGYPAISRADNKTEICSECGVKEAISQFKKYEKPKMKTILIRKVNTKDEIIEETKEVILQRDARPEEYTIVKTIELIKTEYEYFINNLLTDTDFIKDNKDLCAELNTALLIKEVDTNDEEGIIVDPQGSNYARYSGVSVEKVDLKDILRTRENNTKLELEDELNKIVLRVEKLGYQVIIKKEDTI